MVTMKIFLHAILVVFLAILGLHIDSTLGLGSIDTIVKNVIRRSGNYSFNCLREEPMCSLHGDCNRKTLQCDCFSAYTGEICATTSVFTSFSFILVLSSTIVVTLFILVFGCFFTCFFERVHLNIVGPTIRKYVSEHLAYKEFRIMQKRNDLRGKCLRLWCWCFLLPNLDLDLDPQMREFVRTFKISDSDDTEGELYRSSTEEEDGHDNWEFNALRSYQHEPSDQNNRGDGKTNSSNIFEESHGNPTEEDENGSVVPLRERTRVRQIPPSEIHQLPTKKTKSATVTSEIVEIEEKSIYENSENRSREDVMKFMEQRPPLDPHKTGPPEKERKKKKNNDVKNLGSLRRPFRTFEDAVSPNRATLGEYGEKLLKEHLKNHPNATSADFKRIMAKTTKHKKKKEEKNSSPEHRKRKIEELRRGLSSIGNLKKKKPLKKGGDTTNTIKRVKSNLERPREIPETTKPPPKKKKKKAVVTLLEHKRRMVEESSSDDDDIAFLSTDFPPPVPRDPRLPLEETVNGELVYEIKPNREEERKYQQMRMAEQKRRNDAITQRMRYDNEFFYEMMEKRGKGKNVK